MPCSDPRVASIRYDGHDALVLFSVAQVLLPTSTAEAITNLALRPALTTEPTDTTRLPAWRSKNAAHPPLPSVPVCVAVSTRRP